MGIDKGFVFQVLDINDRADLVVGRYLDKVLDSPALAILFAIGYFVDVEPVTSALLGKEEHGMVGRSYEEMFDKVFFTGAASNDSASPTSLLAGFMGGVTCIITVYG